MIKFMIVLYRRPDVSVERFGEILRSDHARMAEALPGLVKYVQNHVAEDPNRPHPQWDAIVELSWTDRAAMEVAWRSPEGRQATEHLREFADLTRTTWSVVEEDIRR